MNLSEPAPEVCNMAKFAGPIPEEAKAFGIESLFPENSALAAMQGGTSPPLNPQNRLLGDTDAAVEFLQERAATHTLWHPQLSFKRTDPVTGEEAKNFETASFARDANGNPDWDKVRRWTDNCQGRGNIYWTVNAAKVMNKKPTKKDIIAVVSLHVDLDPNEDEDQDAAENRLTKKLEGYRHLASIIVKSGGGAWAFYDLGEPIPIDGDPDKIKDAESYNIALAHDLGGDNCHNIDRVARLPGTINIPNAKKLTKGRRAKLASVHRRNQVRHAIERFTKTIVDAVTEARRAPLVGQEATATADKVPKGENFKSSGEYEPINPNDPALAKISQKWSHADYAAEYAGDRSRAAFGFVCECKRAGITDEAIARCLMHWPIGACLREKPNVDRELVRILARGDEFTIDPKLAEMNEKHHVVLHGGKTRVLTWDDDEIYVGRKVPVYQTPDDFKAFHSKYRHSRQIKTKTKDEKGNEKTETKTVTKPLGSWWWDKKERRQYEGLTYAPNTDTDIIGGKLNLWTGFTEAPVKGRGHVGYLKHLRDNVCHGNRAHYNYLIRLMARAVQSAELRGEIGVVLIGKKGIGKNVAVEEFGKLFGPHFWTVTNPEHFTGKFNSHLQHCSILLADECLRPENKVHEQIAKTLVTGQTIMIEPKGVNPYQVKNFLHVFICTNSRWAIPATADERRWFILNVGEKHIKDFPYFKKICDDMEAGGRANLLHYLLNLDISKFEFRDVPETDAMGEQQERTRKGVDLLVEEWCHEGHLPFSQSKRPHVIVTSGSDDPTPSGFDNFIRTKAPNDLRQLGPTRIKRILTKDWGTSRFHGRIDSWLVTGIEFPPLPELRKKFEMLCNGGKPINWPAGNEWITKFAEPAEQTATETATDVGMPDDADAALAARKKTSAG